MMCFQNKAIYCNIFGNLLKVSMNGMHPLNIIQIGLHTSNYLKLKMCL